MVRTASNSNSKPALSNGTHDASGCNPDESARDREDDGNTKPTGADHQQQQQQICAVLRPCRTRKEKHVKDVGATLIVYRMHSHLRCRLARG